MGIFTLLLPCRAGHMLFCLDVSVSPPHILLSNASRVFPPPFFTRCRRFVSRVIVLSRKNVPHVISYQVLKLVSSHFRRSNFTSPGSQPSPFLVVNFQPSWGITPSLGGQLHLVVSKHFFPELSYTV